MFLSYSYENRLTANSYISVAELKSISDEDFFIDSAVINAKTDEELEKFLINSTLIIDNFFNYVSYKYDVNQKLEFPRNFEDPTFINDNIKTATAHFVYQLIIDSSLFQTQETAQIKRNKLDVLEQEFFENKNINKFKNKINLFTLKLLEKYLQSSRIIELARG